MKLSITKSYDELSTLISQSILGNVFLSAGTNYIHNIFTLVSDDYSKNDGISKLLYFYFRLYYKDEHYFKFTGGSFDLIRALNKFAGEFVERASLYFGKNTNIITDTISNLTNRGELYYFPDYILKRNTSKYDIDNIMRTPIAWIEGEYLVSGKKVLVPTFLVYFTPPTIQDKVYKSNISNIYKYLDITVSSNGVASGISREDALAHALLELIERDVSMDWWLYKYKPNKVIKYNNVIKDKPFIIGVFNKYRNIYVSVSLITQTYFLPFLTIGAGCHIDENLAILKSVEEAVFGFHLFHIDNFNNIDNIIDNIEYLNYKTIFDYEVDPYDMGYLYYAFNRENITKIENFVKETFKESNEIYEPLDLLDRIEELKNLKDRTIQSDYLLSIIKNTFINEINDDPIIIDITNELFEDLGIYTYKAISDKLLPFAPYDYILKQNHPAIRKKILNTLPNPFP